jgi:phosphoribosylformimino-5-aminoimidazole carboxamide ribotide isomerase
MASIKLIPVIDLKDGIVVHAKYGQRDNYQPIQSILSEQPDIYSVLNGFLRLHAFDTLYIADLNAITQNGDNSTLIQQVINDFPTIMFWIDAGKIHPQKFPQNHMPILGSEYMDKHCATYLAQFNHEFILSLDYGANGERLGAAELWHEPNYWPKEVIIMTLARVGSSQGVASKELQHFNEAHPNKQCIAAGGVRNMNDIALLKKYNVKAVLLASAFHLGAITAENLKF